MGSGSEAGSYLRLIDFVYHSTLGLRVIKKRRRRPDGVRADRIRTDPLGIVLCPKNFQTSKLNQTTRVAKIDVYYTIRPFKITPGTKVD